MVEAQKYRIEQEMTNLVNELDKSYLRKMQVSLMIKVILSLGFLCNFNVNYLTYNYSCVVLIRSISIQFICKSVESS